MTENAQSSAAERIVQDGAFRVSEFCEWSRSSRATAYREMDAGNLEYIKIGRSRLIPKRAAVKYLAARLHGGAAA